MSHPPFQFLSPLPCASSAVASLANIQLYADTSQRLIFTQSDIALAAYQQSDFVDLKLDLPLSMLGAVAKRQAEYLAGRYLARLAMQQSGLFDTDPPQLTIGHLRAPAWPAQVTGSITHHKHKACVVVLTQPLSAENFVGIDTELWLSAQQANEIAASVHHADEQAILLKAGLSHAMATSLLFSAKEALFKAICPFVDGYFGFETAVLTSYTGSAEMGTICCRSGWLQLQLVTDWVIAKAPQRNYHCWFSCSESDVLTLVCSDALQQLWFGSQRSYTG